MGCIMNYTHAICDKVTDKKLTAEELRNYNADNLDQYLKILGEKAFNFDHGKTAEFNPEYEYDIGDIIQYKGKIYRVTEKALPQLCEVPKIGSKYFQRFDANQVCTKELFEDDVILDLTEFSTFFFKVHKNVTIRIPESTSMREDGKYDIYVSHVGSKSRITFDHEFEGKFIQASRPNVEHIVVVISGDKTYLFQEIMSLGNILGALDTYLSTSGYKKFSELKKLLNI